MDVWNVKSCFLDKIKKKKKKKKKIINLSFAELAQRVGKWLKLKKKNNNNNPPHPHPPFQKKKKKKKQQENAAVFYGSQLLTLDVFYVVTTIC